MNDYPEEMKNCLKKYDDLKKKALKLLPHLKIAKEAQQEFDGLIDSITLGVDGGSLQGVLLFCNLERVTDITKLLTWLAKAGYKQSGTPSDCAELNRRTWDCGSIKVLGFFNGETCKFVKVSEKLEPVYELKCGV